MTKIQDNTAKIKELMAQVKELEQQAKQEAEEKEKAKINAIRELIDSKESPLTLVEVCETHGITTVAEIATIFRSRGPKKEINGLEIDDVLQYVRHNPKSTAVEIILNTDCADDTPRRMAAMGYLVSWGKGRAKKYSVR